MALAPEAAERFYRGRKKMIGFKQMLGCSNSTMAVRTGLSESTVSNLFRVQSPLATEFMQLKLDTVINYFHLNPGWVYGKSKKMLIDNEQLTYTDVCIMALNTPEKRKAMYCRFINVITAVGINQDEFAALANVKRTTVSNWVKRKTRTRLMVESMLKLCEEYSINPKWLFIGEGKPKLNKKPILIDDDVQEKRRKRKKRYWIVNRTTLDEKWRIDPDGYQIIEAIEGHDEGLSSRAY